MMPYQTDQTYEAARPRAVAEQRAADARLGQMAAAVSQLGREVTRPMRALRSLLHTASGRLAGERTRHASRGGAAIPVP
jgi:hypothetical protein